MSLPESTFIIVREDRALDPLTIVTEGLAIGRLTDNELVLNHPTVSRVHAGIKEVGGRFYIFHLSPSNSTTLNGNLVEEKEALADGDVVQIGPFFLYISHDGAALTIRVVYQTAVRIGDTEVHGEGAEHDMHTVGAGAGVVPPSTPSPSKESAAAATSDEAERAALDVFWEKRKREAGKITRPSPLRPRTPPRLGKARFNWSPTRDLARPWPFAVFTWGVVIVSLLSLVAAVGYSSSFSPAPVSNPHALATMSLTPPIAKQANANSCTTCHSLRASMDTNCAACHQTQAFDSDRSDAHAAAGIGCTVCHTEHRGANFRPGVASINANFQSGVEPDHTCTGCHNDNNHQLYNGRRVFTPHGGTLGYPVKDGQWIWNGLEQKEWESKPEEVKKVLAQWPAKDHNQQMSAQFHALHVYRVRATSDMAANESDQISCSSCHRSFGTVLDRDTPRTICAECHAGRIDTRTKRILIAADAPNCTSCHAQHVKDRRHWNPALLTPASQKAMNIVAQAR